MRISSTSRSAEIFGKTKTAPPQKGRSNTLPVIPPKFGVIKKYNTLIATFNGVTRSGLLLPDSRRWCAYLLYLQALPAYGACSPEIPVQKAVLVNDFVLLSSYYHNRKRLSRELIIKFFSRSAYRLSFPDQCDKIIIIKEVGQYVGYRNMRKAHTHRYR